MKKVLAFILTAALVFSFSFTAFASDGEQQAEGTLAAAGGEICEHAWTYSSADLTITAECSKCHEKYKLQIMGIRDGWYDGEEDYIIVDDLYTWTLLAPLIGLDNPVIKYYGRNSTSYAESEKAPMYAGDYNAKLTVNSHTVSYNFTIQPREVLMQGNSKTVTYNGETQSVSGFTVTGNGLVNNDTTNFTSSVSAVDRGQYNASATPWDQIKFYNTAGQDISSSYFVRAIFLGKLHINPRTVSLVTKSSTKYYDGKPLNVGQIYSDYNGNPVDSVFLSQISDLRATGTITNAGSVRTTIEFTPKESYNPFNYTINKNEGTLTVSPRRVSLLTSNIVKTYDGTPIESTEVYGDASGGPVDSIFSSEVTNIGSSGTITDAGTLQTSIHYSPTSRFIASNYSITENPGMLTVLKARLNVKTESASKVYDGTPLTAPGSIDGFINSESATFSVTGSQTSVGVGCNSYSIKWDKTAKEGNYSINEDLGTLTVTSAAGDDVIIDSDSLNKVYDIYSSGTSESISVRIKTDGEIPKQDRKMLKKAAGKKKVEYRSAELVLETDGTETSIGDTNTVPVGVTYSFDFSGKKSFQVFRVHTDAAGNKTLDELKTKPNSSGEYVSYNRKNGTITIYAAKYSTFAIAYYSSGTPKTGDDTMIAMLAAIIAAAASAMIITGIKLKKRER